MKKFAVGLLIVFGTNTMVLAQPNTIENILLDSIEKLENKVDKLIDISQDTRTQAKLNEARITLLEQKEKTFWALISMGALYLLKDIYIHWIRPRRNNGNNNGFQSAKKPK